MKEIYQERLVRFTEHQRREEVLGRRLGWVRFGVFTAGVLSYLGFDVGPPSSTRWYALGMMASLAAFSWLVLWHRRVRHRRAWAATLARINREALHRLDRDWAALPPSRMEDPELRHPYGMDLDIGGGNSLFRLFTTLTHPPGADTLRDWLLYPAVPETVRARQEAVKELAGQVEFRQTLEGRGRLAAGPSMEEIRDFLEWAEGPSWFQGRGWILVVARAIPVFTGALLALHLWGVLAHPFWLVGLAAGFIFSTQFVTRTHPLMERASAGQERFGRYADLLGLLLDGSFRAQALAGLQASVRKSPVGAVTELRHLQRRVSWADVRHSSMAHVPLQAVFAWDLHVLAWLEKWKARSGPHVRSWLSALGELEALAALGALKADHPDWTFPDFSLEASPGVQSAKLGHPLLPPGTCVRNDVEVGPPGSFLFVTGSNMSGKSTLLRALGMNVVLAHAGGPVCAERMRLSPLRVYTSMRTTDSLAEGISQYMAELNRIRTVVEGAWSGGTGTLLYLLDEPLQGTNEAERRVAVQTILGHLLDAGAIGAVATHDLRLDSAPDLRDAARAVHLQGTVEEGDGDPVLTFDFLLKPGRATSTNALALLRAVGLGRDGRGPGPAQS